jgi:CBS domain-containing protein
MNNAWPTGRAANSHTGVFGGRKNRPLVGQPDNPQTFRLCFYPNRTINTLSPLTKPMQTSYPISSILFHKTTALWSIAPEATVFDAIKLMAEKNIGALLVLSGGRLAGLFTERDYARKIVLHGKNSKQTQIFEILPKETLTVTPDDSVEDCMKLMTENRVRHLPVMEGPNVVGIISIGDLVNWIISTQNAAIEQMEQYIAGGVTA